MALTSMKMEPKEAKAEMTCESNPREYPYGLEIHLNEESLAKLGMTELPAVGSELMVTAKVVVTSASQYQTQGNDPDMSSNWQITEMEVAPAAKDVDQAAVLYGS